MFSEESSDSSPSSLVASCSEDISNENNTFFFISTPSFLLEIFDAIFCGKSGFTHRGSSSNNH